MLKAKIVGNLFIAVGFLLLAWTFYQLYAPTLLPSSPPIYDPVIPQNFVSMTKTDAAKVDLAENVLKALFGYSSQGAHNYLIFTQDYLEARPTGGFPGTYTFITTENGQIKQLQFDDIWNFDKPLEKLNQPQLQQFAWWADFPQAANYAAKVFAKNKGINIDGVVTIDPTGMKYILKALGPLYVNQFQQLVTAENVVDKILSYSPYTKDKPNKPQHKLFMGYLVKAMHEKLSEYETLTKRKQVAKAFLQALQQKHILIYFQNKKNQALLEHNNWDGSLRTQSVSDFLAIRDYNAGVNKADLYLDRKISYKVNIRNKMAFSELKITYFYKYDKFYYQKYGALADNERKQYKNILKVYVPNKTLLIETNGYDSYVKQLKEGSKKVFQGLLTLNPGRKKTVTLKYRLPFFIERQYQLIVNKQPGIPIFDKKPPEINVKLLLKKQAIEGYYPQYSQLSKNSITFKQKLIYDRYFKVNLLPLAY